VDSNLNMGPQMQTRSAKQLTAMVGDIVATIEVIIPLDLCGKVMKGELLNMGGGLHLCLIFRIRLLT
jgi:hypothetical protein